MKTLSWYLTLAAALAGCATLHPPAKERSTAHTPVPMAGPSRAIASEKGKAVRRMAAETSSRQDLLDSGVAELGTHVGVVLSCTPRPTHSDLDLSEADKSLLLNAALQRVYDWFVAYRAGAQPKLAFDENAMGGALELTWARLLFDTDEMPTGMPLKNFAAFNAIRTSLGSVVQFAIDTTGPTTPAVIPSFASFPTEIKEAQSFKDAVTGYLNELSPLIATSAYCASDQHLVP